MAECLISNQVVQRPSCNIKYQVSHCRPRLLARAVNLRLKRVSPHRISSLTSAISKMHIPQQTPDSVIVAWVLQHGAVQDFVACGAMALHPFVHRNHCCPRKQRCHRSTLASARRASCAAAFCAFSSAFRFAFISCRLRQKQRQICHLDIARGNGHAAVSLARMHVRAAQCKRH